MVTGAPYYIQSGIQSGAAFVYRGVAGGSFFLIPNPSGSATLIYLD